MTLYWALVGAMILTILVVPPLQDYCERRWGNHL